MCVCVGGVGDKRGAKQNKKASALFECIICKRRANAHKIRQEHTSITKTYSATMIYSRMNVTFNAGNNQDSSFFFA